MRVDVAVDVGVCHCLGLIIVVLCCHLFLDVGDAVIFFSSHFGVFAMQPPATFSCFRNNRTGSVCRK